MSVNKLFENWRSFTQGNEAEAPKEYTTNSLTDKSSLGPLDEEEILVNEIDDHQLEMISSFLGSRGKISNKLSFSNIFGDDLRKMIPFATEDQNSEIFKLKELLKDLGYSVDWNNAIASKKKKRFVAKLGKEVESEEKMKIGKLLSSLVSFQKKLGELKKEEVDLRGKIHHYKWGAGSEEGGHEEKLADAQSKYENNSEKYDKLRAVLKDKFGSSWNHALVQNWNPSDRHALGKPKVIELADFWNKKSEFYRQNPKELEGDTDTYSIIISRAPIDVIRMSDHSDWTSCHTPGNGYFECAVAESVGHGLVAYVIRNEDLIDYAEEEQGETVEEVLQEDEIFKDRERRQGGISPLSRVRLRKFSFEDKNENVHFLAVPENRIYGKRFPNFLETIENWARKVQEDVNPIKYDENGKAVNPDDKPKLRHMKRYGGSYADTEDTNLLNDFFGLETKFRDDEGNGYPSSRNVYWVDPGEDDFKETNYFDQYVEAADRLQDYYDQQLEHCRVWHDVEEHGHNDVYVSFSGHMIVEFDDVEFLRMPKWNDRDLRDDLYKAFESVLGGGIDGIEFDGDTIRIDLNSGDYEPSPDGFERFGDWVNEVDNYYEKIQTAFLRVLEEHEIVALHPIAAMGKELENLDLENFEVDIEDGDVWVTQVEEFYLGTAGLDDYRLRDFISSREVTLKLGELIEKMFNDHVHRQLRLPGISRSDIEDEHDYMDDEIPFEVNPKIIPSIISPGVNTKIGGGTKFRTDHEYLNGVNKKLGFRVGFVLRRNEEWDREINFQFYSEYLKFLDKNFYKFGELVKSMIANEVRKRISDYKLVGAFQEMEDKVGAILSEIEPYQKELQKKHPKWKMRLIGKGGNKKKEGPGIKSPSMKRSKSAPPGAGGV